MNCHVYLHIEFDVNFDTQFRVFSIVHLVLINDFPLSFWKLELVVAYLEGRVWIGEFYSICSKVIKKMFHLKVV